MSRLFLLDGYALIYRAFFALITRPLRTGKGENTSAAWGVTNFLLRLAEKHRPDYLVWVNDAGDSFRTAEYAEYKSTREKLDEELQADFDTAVERIRTLLAAFRIPLVEVDGYEADDVIGTLARKGAAAGVESVIVSGDKDFYQLIGPGIALLNPGRGGPAGVDEVWVDESNASDRLGVPPRQVTDWLALVGDSSDNVPGVRGIGEKGAAQLLTEFGDLETLIERADEIAQKRSREALKSQVEEARLSRRLVTIMTDVPVELDLDAFAVRPPDGAAVARIFNELEFHSLLGRLESLGNGSAAAPESTVAAPERQVGIVDDPAELPALAARLRKAPLVAFDTETSSLQPHDAELIGLSLAASKDEVWYLPFGHRAPPGDLLDGDNPKPEPRNLPPITDPALEPIRSLLEDPAVAMAAHHAKYDIQVLRRAGVEVRGLAYDSMLASFVIDPSRRSHAIDALSLEFLGVPMSKYGDLVGKGRAEIPFAEVAVDRAAAYCGADSATVLALREHFAADLEQGSLAKLLAELELPLVPVLADMEWIGIAIDTAHFARLSEELSRDLGALETTIRSVAGVEGLNLNSPLQLAEVLFDKLQLPVIRRTKTGPSTDAAVLEALAEQGHELPRLILQHRELQKLKSTYVDVLPAAVNGTTGRIHTSFNQVGAQTGRIASSDPNLQNIPIRTARGEEIRRGFVPRKGWKFVVADYSQIELRLMAHFSGDPAFVEAFRSGGDIHRQTAAIIFGVDPADVTGEMRSRAKTINFGTIYGQGPFALSNQLGIPQDEAKAFITDYFTRFAGVRAWLDAQVELAREQGYVETLLGRRRYIAEIHDRNFNLRSFAERTAQNTPLQGSAADLIKRAMIAVHQALPAAGLQSCMLLQVHDELVFESPVDEVERTSELVRAHMEGAAELKVPLVVDIGVGDNWRDAKSS
ncbi:MAG TPA: DNA polymerase I [Gemmatimonadales bacterium]|nr:DNA polymerase I [Gemmatimonadales bacterium]